MSTVRRTLALGAPPEEVFDLLADPVSIPRWWPLIRIFEPHPGGRFEMGADGWTVGGEVVELERPRVVAYTWRVLQTPPGVTPPPGERTVRWELERDEKATRLTLTHAGFPDDVSAGHHERQWRPFLASLEELTWDGR